MLLSRRNQLSFFLISQQSKQHLYFFFIEERYQQKMSEKLLQPKVRRRISLETFKKTVKVQFIFGSPHVYFVMLIESNDNFKNT
jgi:hypothetical protein